MDRKRYTSSWYDSEPGNDEDRLSILSIPPAIPNFRIEPVIFREDRVRERPVTARPPSVSVSTPPVADDPQYPTGLALVILIIALCLSMFLIALDQTIIATAIPKITDDFHTVADIGWYGSVSASFDAFGSHAGSPNPERPTS